jgi:hypothetical protein
MWEIEKKYEKLPEFLLTYDFCLEDQLAQMGQIDLSLPLYRVRTHGGTPLEIRFCRIVF